MALEDIFRTGNAAQDNFRSRLFGMFSEDVVRYWAASERSPYACIGRPTIWDGSLFATIDFTLQTPDGRTYVAEQKAEMAWMNYAYLRLERTAQIDRHRGKPAFDWFLDAAREPRRRLVKNGVKGSGKPIAIDGAILVWGAVSSEGRAAAIEQFGFADVLGLEDLIADLITWRDEPWAAHIGELAGYAAGLFSALSWAASD
jgi:hypothetical protein